MKCYIPQISFNFNEGDEPTNRVKAFLEGTEIGKMSNYSLSSKKENI